MFLSTLWRQAAPRRGRTGALFCSAVVMTQRIARKRIHGPPPESGRLMPKPPRLAPRGTSMNEAEIGWIAAIIIGGLAGWLAEMFMKSGTGILMNIVLGIVGAALANWLLGLFGMALGGWLGYLVAGFIGACIIIMLWRMIAARRA